MPTAAPPDDEPYNKRNIGPQGEIYQYAPTQAGMRTEWTKTAGSGAGVTPPLWLVQVDDTHVKVTLGTVNGITPTDVNTSIAISGDTTFYLHATLGADGVPTAVELLTGSVPSDDADNAYILVGMVSFPVDEITEVNPSLAWSQTFVTCGRDPEDPTTTSGTYFWVVA